uniref:Profilin n=1 Tax=Ganoderma boninense TaxID=34458 RepID=A0A5K1K167_9APHY|nr:Uncharacterized protein [Ganoderma boninense]
MRWRKEGNDWMLSDGDLRRDGEDRSALPSPHLKASVRPPLLPHLLNTPPHAPPPFLSLFSTALLSPERTPNSNRIISASRNYPEYVDSNLIGTGKVSKAAIIGLQGGVWASSPGYTLSAEEQKAVVRAFEKPDEAQAGGVRLGGQKFFVLMANDRSIYAKKQGDGAVLVKTKQAVLVAEYAAPIQAPETTPVVEGLADYLIGVGY